MPSHFTPETPWLHWVKWRKVQRYTKANPAWIASCTSLWTDPHYRSIWQPHGDAGFALIHKLLYHLAQHSVSGVVWGDPALLAETLDLAAAPDLSWLVEAGWIEYIGRDRKKEIEASLDAPKKPKKEEKAPKPPAAPSAREEQARRILAARPQITCREMAAHLHCSSATICGLQAWKSRARAQRGTGTGTETNTETVIERSGAPFTNNTSVAAIAAPPETETGQKQAQPQPEDGHRPQDSTGPADTLALVSSLPSPVPALVGLPGASAALPPESDLRGAGPPRGANPSPGSFRRPPGALLLGDCLGPLAMARQCPEVWDWVSSVFKLLRFGFAIDSVEGRRECGSFTAAYNKVLGSAMPLGEKNKILVSSLKTAEQKGRKPNGYYRKGKGAVFCSVLNQRLEKHLALVGVKR